EEVDRLRAVACRPIPLRIEIEERPVREDDDARVPGLRRQIRLQPGKLLAPDARRRVGYVVDRDEMDALVVEAVVARAEKLLPRLPVVERGVVFTGHEAHVLVLEALDDVAELDQAPPSLLRIVRGVRQVAGEDYEVGLVLEAVH